MEVGRPPDFATLLAQIWKAAGTQLTAVIQGDLCEAPCTKPAHAKQPRDVNLARHILQSCLNEVQDSTLLLTHKASMLCPFSSRNCNGAKEARPHPRELTFYCYLCSFLRQCLTPPRLATNLLSSQRLPRPPTSPVSRSPVLWLQRHSTMTGLHQDGNGTQGFMIARQALYQ